MFCSSTWPEHMQEVVEASERSPGERIVSHWREEL